MQRIMEGGELIVATISGPDTYFDYQGTGMGLQYALAEDFASSIGVGVRVMLFNDTTALVQALHEGQADVIAVQLPETFCRKHKLQPAGVTHSKPHTSWAVQPEASDWQMPCNIGTAKIWKAGWKRKKMPACKRVIKCAEPSGHRLYRVKKASSPLTTICSNRLPPKQDGIGG